jgi:CRP-like cAMP-binding protein
MRAGEPVEALHILTEGRLALERDGKSLGKLEAPQTLGFLGIIARTDGAYDAIAEVDTHSLELRTEALLEIMEDHFEFLLATLRYAAQRLLYEMRELPESMLSIPPERMPIAVPERRLDVIEKVLILRSMAVFKRTNISALALLSDLMEEHRYEPGKVMWEVGDPPAWSLFLIDGFVTCEAADGRRFRYGPGTAVGGVETIAQLPRWYRATTETPVVALHGLSDRIVDFMEDNFDLGSDFVAMLAGGLGAMLARKAAMGQQAFAQKRDVSTLGAVAVGA